MDNTDEKIEYRFIELDKEISHIKSQIDEAENLAESKVTPINIAWRHKAKFALRMKNIERSQLIPAVAVIRKNKARKQQDVLIEEARKRKAEFKLNRFASVERAFVDVARRKLDGSVFRAMMAEALSATECVVGEDAK